MFLFVVSDTEFRIYNCYEKPKYLKRDANYGIRYWCTLYLYFTLKIKRLSQKRDYIKRGELRINEKEYNIKIIDPASGSDIFGVEINSFAIRVTAFSLYLALVEQLDHQTL